ncbi:hypothetical protein [Trichothermofontia sp.]
MPPYCRTTQPWNRIQRIQHQLAPLRKCLPHLFHAILGGFEGRDREVCSKTGDRATGYV